MSQSHDVSAGAATFSNPVTPPRLEHRTHVDREGRSPGLAWVEFEGPRGRIAAASSAAGWKWRALARPRLRPRRTVLCYVDHHDAAYAWAGRRRLDVHDTTGAAQIVVIDERTEEVVKRVPRVVIDEGDPAPERPFARLDDAALLAYGVPRAWLRRVRAATLDEFLDDIGDALPNEAQEYLLGVADGETPEVPARSRDPFTHPDARRRFYLLDEADQALRNALAAPWATWQLFLHPTQRAAVEAHQAGPARVTGGPAPLQVAGALAVTAFERGWAASPERIGGRRPPDRRPRARTNVTST